MHLTKTNHLATFLLSLIKEYQDLSSKLYKISELINEYGGELPEKDISPSVQLSQEPQPQVASTDDRTPELPQVTVVENAPVDTNNTKQSAPDFQIPIVVENVLNAVINPMKPTLDKSTANSITLGFEYPQYKAAWGKKILYALRISGKPSTAKEIFTFMQKHEPSDRLDHVESMVRQYTGTLAKNGLIGVDNSAHAHKYFLKT